MTGEGEEDEEMNWTQRGRAGAAALVVAFGMAVLAGAPADGMTGPAHPAPARVGEQTSPWAGVGTRARERRAQRKAPAARLRIARHITALVRTSARAPALGVVRFVDARHGWAAGATLLATGDGGRTWRRQPSPAATVSALDFVDPRHGWALGWTAASRPVFARTTDGGRTWHGATEPRVADGPEIPSLHVLQHVQFVSATFRAGVAGGVTYLGGAGRGDVVVTTDGGQTWQALHTPAPVAAACFADRRHGWAAVAGKGLLLYTADGGRSWRQSLPDGAVGAAFFTSGADLACTGPADVWVLLSGPGGMSQETYALYHTRDGGAHWTAVAAKLGIGGEPAPGTPGIPLQASRASRAGRTIDSYAGPLAAVDSTVAYVGGACSPCGATSLSGTADGGRTWHNRGLISGVDAAFLVSLSFVSARRGWLTTSLYSPDSPPVGHGVLLATADGGHTWREQYPSALPRPSLALSFPTPALGYGLGTVGDARAVLRTTDGGRRWLRVGTLPVSRPGRDVPVTASLSFGSVRRGWAVGGDHTLDTTADGGGAWRQLTLVQLRSPSNPQGWVGAVAFTDERHGCVASLDWPATYWGTDDAGTHWRPVPGVAGVAGCAAHLAGYPAARALAIAAPTTDSGFADTAGVTGALGAWVLQRGCSYPVPGPAVGQHLLVTGDGGRHWTQVTWPRCSFTVQDASFATARDGWLLTHDERLYRTADGGATWTELP